MQYLTSRVELDFLAIFYVLYLCYVCRFSRIDIDVSAPIVPLRETIVPPPTTDRVNELIESDVNRQQTDTSSQLCKTVIMTTVNRQCVVHIRAVPLPSSVIHSLIQHVHLIKTANKLSSAVTSADKSDVLHSVSKQIATELQQFRLELETEFTAAAAADDVWSTAVDRIWSFSRNGTNILLNGIEGYERLALWSALDGSGRSGSSLREYDSAVVSGFQIATQSGPLCEEPMMGVCFVIEKWIVSDVLQDNDTNLPQLSDEVLFTKLRVYGWQKMTLVRFWFSFAKKLHFLVQFRFYKINCGFGFRFVFLHCVLFSVYALSYALY